MITFIIEGRPSPMSKNVEELSYGLLVMMLNSAVSWFVPLIHKYGMDFYNRTPNHDERHQIRLSNEGK